MLRFDRYLPVHDRVIDVASGQLVEIEAHDTRRAELRLFQSRAGRTLIDLEAGGDRRVEIWERWAPGPQPAGVDLLLADFAELLECARLGAPRAFDLKAATPRQHAYLQRLFAREARVRGWIPVALDVLATAFRERQQKLPPWIDNRSLVIFADVPAQTKDATLALLQLARRDARPHVLVRRLRPGENARVPFADRREWFVVHEELDKLAAAPAPDAAPAGGVRAEAAARWQWLLDGMAHARPAPERTLQLASLLAARDQPFEARALVERLASTHGPRARDAEAVMAEINQRAISRAGRGWEMVDDFVDVLQLCQDTEDEHVALARVGAFLRERLQASSVAFVVREGTTPRVLARVGSAVAGLDLALRTIDTGVALRPDRVDGPVECASPVRHAAEVIGALWCRWTAGMAIAPQQASTLVGMAAAAAAPSVRLAMAKTAPERRGANPVPELVGESVAITLVRDAIVRAAASPFPVVIEGESGSGKELAARAIHARSARRERRFCAINCAALVDDLVEAELFGHVRGAFTGAHVDRPGLFEEASGGTLFMDEIAELGARVQAKLLRVLQEGEVRRVGESIVRRVDVRMVAATNRPLAEQVSAGTFRADLWYRLDVVRITMPPLRQRLDDIPLLADHLWRALAARTGSRARLSPASLRALTAYDWPGNVRELQNVLASLLVAAPNAGLVGPSALPAHVGRAAALDRATTLADARRQFEERYVRAALARAGGRTATAARDLGISRQGLTKLMGRLGIDQPRAT
jgi:DNA-binding NtrC family response regulator